MLNWARSNRYADGWFIGGEGENGQHLREPEGWPYSVYKRAAEIGVTDVVLCHGIQNLTDAQALCSLLNVDWHNANPA